MTYGPTNPPRLPAELINAIAAAAAGPLRNAVGSAQNGDGNEYSAIVATENAPIARAICLPAAILSDRATPTMNSGTAAWRRRSPVRSECDAMTSIAGIAQSHGIPDRRITSVW